MVARPRLNSRESAISHVRHGGRLAARLTGRQPIHHTRVAVGLEKEDVTRDAIVALVTDHLYPAAVIDGRHLLG